MTPVVLDASALESSVAFTGRLACMTRAEAFAGVRRRGGTPSETVTKKTKLLIVGELGWPLLDDGRPSNKLSRATTNGVPVVSERRFGMDRQGHPDSVHKTYSADQLAALSKLSSNMNRELAQFGLLDERGGSFGFRDLASARQIATLLADGVRLSEIIRSVSEIRRWLPDAGLANVRLESGVNSLEVEQLGGVPTDAVSSCLRSRSLRTILTRCLSEHNPLKRWETLQRPSASTRLLMKSDPTDASAPFNLGNMLRGHARNVEGEAALRAATRADPTFAEAWYNLGDLLDEQGRSEAAIECLRKALQVAPDYADAKFDLALLLQRKNQYAEAADYWSRYLAADHQSRSATRARRSLKFCEMQVRLVASA